MLGIFLEELKPEFILKERLGKCSQNLHRDEKNQYKFEIVYEQLELTFTKARAFKNISFKFYLLLLKLEKREMT